MNPTAALLEPEVQDLVRGKHYAELREVLHSLQRADVADILSEIDPDDAAVAFRILPRDDAGEVFAYLSPEQQEQMIARLGQESAVSLVESMDSDDRVRLLDELPTEVAQRLVASLTPDERKKTQAILGYPERTVGRLMTPDYVRVKPEWTVARALEHIRRTGRDAETINVVYVVDDQGVLVDDIRLRQIIMAEPDQTVDGLMNHQFITLKADQPQEEAVLALQKYDRVALPVVDSRGVLLGIVTHDDVADVAQQEATEDMQKIGGMAALEEPYMSTPVLGLFKKRAPWLALLFASELLTSNAIAAFEGEIQRAAILAAFIPAIISSGGNSGSQTSTMMVRALGVRELELKDWWKVLLRELQCGLLLGLMIGCIGIFRVNLWGWMGWWHDPDVARHYTILSFTIACTLLFVVLWGSIMGAMLPFILKRIRLDPATSSGPFVATLVDVTGIVIYFNIAILILSTTLLSPDHVAPKPLRLSSHVEVLQVKPYSEGDGGFELVVRPQGSSAGLDDARTIRVPRPALSGDFTPKVGDTLPLDFEVHEAVSVTQPEPAPRPTP